MSHVVENNAQEFFPLWDGPRPCRLQQGLSNDPLVLRLVGMTPSDPAIHCYRKQSRTNKKIRKFKPNSGG